MSTGNLMPRFYLKTSLCLLVTFYAVTTDDFFDNGSSVVEPVEPVLPVVDDDFQFQRESLRSFLDDVKNVLVHLIYILVDLFPILEHAHLFLEFVFQLLKHPVLNGMLKSLVKCCRSPLFFITDFIGFLSSIGLCDEKVVVILSVLSSHYHVFALVFSYILIILCVDYVTAKWSQYYVTFTWSPYNLFKLFGIVVIFLIIVSLTSFA